MITVNLLPGSGKKKQRAAVSAASVDLGALRARLAGRVADPWLAGTIAVCLLALALGGWLYIGQDRQARALAEAEEKAVTDSSRYARVLAEQQRAIAKRDTILRQLNLVQALDADRYIWPHILEEVSRALPPFTWLTAISYAGTPQGSTNHVLASPPPPSGQRSRAPAPEFTAEIPQDTVMVRILGRTADIQALTRFMRDLEVSPFLDAVQLDNSQLAVEQGRDLTSFQLTVRYARPDSTMIRRVPLAVTVR
jgi:Tfp pilus assembly protein PilN